MLVLVAPSAAGSAMVAQQLRAPEAATAPRVRARV